MITVENIHIYIIGFSRTWKELLGLLYLRAQNENFHQTGVYKECEKIKFRYISLTCLLNTCIPTNQSQGRSTIFEWMLPIQQLGTKAPRRAEASKKQQQIYLGFMAEIMINILFLVNLKSTRPQAVQRSSSSLLDRKIWLPES